MCVRNSEDNVFFKKVVKCITVLLPGNVEVKVGSIAIVTFPAWWGGVKRRECRARWRGGTASGLRGGKAVPTVQALMAKGSLQFTCMFYKQTADAGHVTQTLLLLLNIRMSSHLKNRFLILMGFCIKHYQTKGEARKGDLSLLMSTNENLKSALPQMSRRFVYIKNKWMLCVYFLLNVW